MEKDVGIVRKLDELGRIVIPREVFQIRGIKPKDAVEIFIKDSEIILRKYIPGCAICNNLEKLKIFKGKQVCRECLSDITTKY